MKEVLEQAPILICLVPVAVAVVAYVAGRVWKEDLQAERDEEIRLTWKKK